MHRSLILGCFDSLPRSCRERQLLTKNYGGKYKKLSMISDCIAAKVLLFGIKAVIISVLGISYF